jgi:hypothetical protein
VMIRLYSSLIRSKTHCGSFVYGMAKKSKLSITDPVHNTGIFLLLAPFAPAVWTACLWNPLSPHYQSVGIFSSATTSRGWQRNPRFLHTYPCSIPLSATTCGRSASRSPTATWHTVTPLYPPPTPTGFTLSHPTPYPRSATCQVHSRHKDSSHVPWVLCGVTLASP